MKTVYYNGQVYSGEPRLCQAFEVEDGRFSFVGTDAQALKRQADAYIDLEGAFVSPGFIDSHMHLLNLGQALSVAPLAENTGSLEEMLACLAKARPWLGGWILGRGWNQDLFSDTDRMPNRYDLDRVSREVPICAVRCCGHAMAVNSRALELLDITPNTPQPEGGAIGRENGDLNGLFFDNAMDLVYAALPAPEPEDLKNMLRSACEALNAQGITGCHSDDFGVFQALPWQQVCRAYRELEEEGALTVRVYQQANFTSRESLEAFISAGGITGAGTDLFKIGPLKMLGDGALGARTAFLSRPYADDPSTRGLSVFSRETFEEMIGCAHKAGLQVAIHCIGDACLDLVLDAIEKAQTAFPREDCRHGIVHCQITRPDQLRRIAALKLHVYAQSIFLDYDIHIVEPRAGKELAETSYSWKTLLELGATVSNGSDCPVEYPRVLAGIQCAVTRRDLKGRGPYLPEQSFTREEALKSFTEAGSYASFEEACKGRIRPGMLADFVLLGENPLTVPEDRIKDIPILKTYLQGRRVYPRE